MRLASITEVYQKDVCERSICFDSFSQAKSFSKDLVKKSYEITQVEISVRLSQGEGTQPNIKVLGEGFVYVDFLYNAYCEHDKKLLLNLLKAYNKYIWH